MKVIPVRRDVKINLDESRINNWHEAGEHVTGAGGREGRSRGRVHARGDEPVEGGADPVLRHQSF